MARLTSITGIGRGLDLDLRSNRVALAGAAAATVAYAGFALATGDEIADSLIAGIVVFLAWAIGRELDPDRPRVAAWAMLVAFGAAVYDLPSGIVTAVALIAIRLVAGTPGAAVTWVDVAVLVLLGFVSGSSAVLWIAALIFAIWLLTSPEVGPLKWIALGSLIGGTVAGFRAAEAPVVVVGQDAYILAAVGGVVMMLAMRPSVVISRTDAGTELIQQGRIGLARRTAGTFVMWAAVMGGVAGFWAISPVLAALTATAFAKWFVRGA